MIKARNNTATATAPADNRGGQMEEDSVQATPKKLKDGTWGARVQGAVEPGDTITITTRAGKSWDAIVDRVLWSDEQAMLVSTVSPEAAVPTHDTQRAAAREPLAHGEFIGAGMRNPDAGELLVHRTVAYDDGEIVRVRGQQGYWTVVACGSHRITEWEDDTREGERLYDAIIRPATDAEAEAARQTDALIEAAKQDAAAATEAQGLRVEAWHARVAELTDGLERTQYGPTLYRADLEAAELVAERPDDVPASASYHGETDVVCRTAEGDLVTVNRHDWIITYYVSPERARELRLASAREMQIDRDGAERGVKSGHIGDDQRAMYQAVIDGDA